MRKEPALALGGITAVVGAGIALLVAFGVHITPEQKVAILGFVAAAAPLVSAALTRSRVTPVGRHRA